jgi:hypothetical protein
MTEEELARLVTRDSMIGTGLPRLPKTAKGPSKSARKGRQG